MPHCLLDEIVFMPGPLGELPPTLSPRLEIQLSTGTASRQRPTVPLLARKAPMAPDHPTWPAYCKLLKDLGIPLRVESAALEQLPLSSMPPRVASRAFNEALSLQDVQTAEAIEIRCLVDNPHGAWARLPLEIRAWHELKLLVECMRELAGLATPIGLHILAGDIYTDVSNALAARVDYLVIDFSRPGPLSTSALNHLTWIVAAARQAAEQSGWPNFPIVIEAAVESPEHLIKLLALGATAISIDAVIQAAMPKTPEPETTAPKGLLSGIGALPMPARPGQSIEPVARRLKALLEQMRQQLLQVQLGSVDQLHRDHLRSLSEQATKLCGIKPLEIH